MFLRFDLTAYIKAPILSLLRQPQSNVFLRREPTIIYNRHSDFNMTLSPQDHHSAVLQMRPELTISRNELVGLCADILH